MEANYIIFMRKYKESHVHTNNFRKKKIKVQCKSTFIIFNPVLTKHAKFHDEVQTATLKKLHECNFAFLKTKQVIKDGTGWLYMR